MVCFCTVVAAVYSNILQDEYQYLPIRNTILFASASDLILVLLLQCLHSEDLPVSDPISKQNLDTTHLGIVCEGQGTFASRDSQSMQK